MTMTKSFHFEGWIIRLWMGQLKETTGFYFDFYEGWVNRRLILALIQKFYLLKMMQIKYNTCVIKVFLEKRVNIL